MTDRAAFCFEKVVLAHHATFVSTTLSAVDAGDGLGVGTACDLTVKALLTSVHEVIGERGGSGAITWRPMEATRRERMSNLCIFPLLGARGDPHA